MSGRLKMRVEVGHCGIIPPGWRMAWYEPRRRVGVYYPSPLHWILRALREIVYRIAVAFRAPTIECMQLFDLQRSHHHRQKMADEYARGYLIGWRECFQVCLATVEEELARSDDLWEIGALLSDAPNPPKDN